MRGRLALPLVVLFGLVVRLPFWREGLRTPLDGDGAVLGLMAMHPLQGSTMWGQPYGSPVEAWLVAPFVAVMGPRLEAVRLAQLVLSLALIPLAWLLGRRLDPRAAVPAAVLMACPPPYFLLLSAMPPPLYPAALLLGWGGLVTALAARERLQTAADARWLLAGWGLLCGLALWTHLMTAALAAVGGVALVRAGGWRRVLPWVVLPLLLASAPWWTRAVAAEEQATRVIAVSDRSETFAGHLAAVAPRLHEPLLALLGLETPLVPDEPDFRRTAPGLVRGGLVLVYGLAFVAAVWTGAVRGAPGVLLAAAGLTLLVFPLPLRSGPGSIRFLTPLWLPLASVLLWAAAIRGGTRRALVVALALGALHLGAATPLLAAWRAADRQKAPFLLVDLAPVRALLQAQGIRHAYASYGPAWRLTFESGGLITASQPWNERFRHYPLPYLADVRSASRVAWVLTPAVPTDLPNPQAFAHALAGIGGTYRRTAAGPALVFHGFAPPFAPDVVHPDGAAAAGDGDPTTAALPSPGRAAVVVAVTPPAALDAITLIQGLDGPTLPRSVDVEVSEDGTTFRVVASRRRREERADLRWINGQPQYVIDDSALSVPLGGRVVASVRVRPVDSEDAWSLGELLLHPAQPGVVRQPWTDWLDPRMDRDARGVQLRNDARRDRADWYTRLLLAR